MARTAREEWRASWPIPVIGLIGMAGTSLPTVTAGVFMRSFGTRFGWDRTTFSSGLVVLILLGVSLMPIAGRIIDRVGTRQLALTGIVTYSCAIAALGLLNGSVAQWWFLCAVLAVSGQFVSPTIWTAATAGRFDVSRGLALAVTLSGIGLSTAVSPLLATFYLDRFGAAAAYPLLALSWGGLALPLVLFGFHPKRRAAEPARPVQSEGVAYRTAITSRSFITLCVAGSLFSIITYAMIVHLVPILTDNGIDAAAAAGIMGAMGLSAMFGRLVGGALLDRFPARIVGAAGFLLPIVAIVVLLHAGSSVVLSAAAAIAFGLANGAEIDLASFLIARYYGMRNFGGIYAIAIATAGGSAALGPVIAGFLYDQTGSYEAFQGAAIVPLALGAILIASLPRVPRLADGEAVAAPTLP